MHTVMIGKQKGGVGASTCCRELAVAAADAGQVVAVVDLDPQRTLTRWWARRQQEHPPADGEQANPALIQVAHDALPASLDRLATAGVDLVIVDTPPSIHSFVLDLAKRVNLVLCPVRPTTDDLDALRVFLDALGTVPHACVITQSPVRYRMYDEALALLAQRVRVAPPLRFRVEYAAAPGEGLTAYETKSTKAAQEVRALWEWLAEAITPRPVIEDARTIGRKRRKT